MSIFSPQMNLVKRYIMNFNYWAVLGCQGCTEKNPTCHKYATFQATITCFHYNGAFTVASFILISILLNFSFLYVLVFLKNARTSPFF